MQKRHTDREQYFAELALTSERHLLPYIQRFHPIGSKAHILELGCGEGGNLLPFAQRGCHVVGIDLCKERVTDAQRFFKQHNAKGEFFVGDITRPIAMAGKFDIILCHDVIEHIADKQALLSQLPTLLEPDGFAFIAFPAWQMPFGGHQQICRSKVLSHLPWLHLFPRPIYRLLLRLWDENEGCIEELLSIKRTRLSVEQFEYLLSPTPLKIHHRQLWLINPHYEAKFGLTPRRILPLISRIPYLRNFFSTSCFYICSTQIGY